MKKTLYRILAFGLDTLILTIIVAALSYLPFISPNHKKVEKYTKDALELREKYVSFSSELDKMFEDNKISEEEYNKIPDEYREYFNIVIDEEIESDKQAEIKDNINKYVLDNYNDLSYQISKMSVRGNYVSVIVYILYFGILQYFLNGKTLFKKLFRLQVVDAKNPEKKISIIKYIIRSILVSEAIFIIIDAILIKTSTKTSYISATSTLSTIKMIYEMIFLLFMAIRIDGRSLHDLLLGTRVVLYDKKGIHHSSVVKVKRMDRLIDRY